MKTGGHSICAALSKYIDEVDDKRHSAFHHFPDLLLAYPAYYKFAFVRNPWDHVVSFYSHMGTNKGRLKITFREFLRQRC